MEQISFNHTKRLLEDKISIVFYDMTTIYFESSEEDDFRIKGFSKDGKNQYPQIYLVLLIGINGYPIGYDIFDGNIFEGHTLIPVMKLPAASSGVSKYLPHKANLAASCGELTPKEIREDLILKGSGNKHKKGYRSNEENV